jgi:hypothetical protein
VKKHSSNYSSVKYYLLKARVSHIIFNSGRLHSRDTSLPKHACTTVLVLVACRLPPVGAVGTNYLYKYRLKVLRMKTARRMHRDQFQLITGTFACRSPALQEVTRVVDRCPALREVTRVVEKPRAPIGDAGGW